MIELNEIKADEKDKATVLAELAAEIWREHYTPIIGVDQVEYMLRKFQSAGKILSDIRVSDYRYFTMSEDGKLAGYCAAKPGKIEEGLFLSKLYVKKECRGKGFSRLFLKRLEELARENQLTSIWLTVNKNNADSIAAYKRLGFAVEEELVTDIGGGFVMDDYKMRKMLSR